MPDTTDRNPATSGGAGAALGRRRPAPPFVTGRNEDASLAVLLDIAPHRDRLDLVKRAAGGDEAAIEDLVEQIGGPALEELTGGDLGRLARDLIALDATNRQGHGPDARLEYRGILAAHHRVYCELAGANPGPVEARLAEVAALAWLDYMRCVKRAELAGGSLAVLEYHQRRVHRAHARYVRSLSELGRARKLSPVAVRVAAANVQVNVAGSPIGDR